jgi:Flp pilus assembly protein TadG
MSSYGSVDGGDLTDAAKEVRYGLETLAVAILAAEQLRQGTPSTNDAATIARRALGLRS